MNTHTTFETGLRSRIAKCEQEMRRAGWIDPDFDERSYRGTPVEASCREIESYILSYNVLRAGSIEGLAHAHPSRSPLGKISLYHSEALLLGLATDGGAVRLPLDRGVSTSVGYVGIRPVKDEREGSAPYLGPYMVAFIETSGVIGDTCSDILPKQSFCNPFGLLRMANIRFTPLQIVPNMQNGLS